MNRNFIEDNKLMPKGRINAILFKGDYDKNTGKINGEILQEFDEHNVIVESASILMASRMAPTSPRVVAQTENNKNGIIENDPVNGLKVGTYNMSNYTKGTSPADGIDTSNAYDNYGKIRKDSYITINPGITGTLYITFTGSGESPILKLNNTIINSLTEASPYKYEVEEGYTYKLYGSSDKSDTIISTIELTSENSKITTNIKTVSTEEYTESTEFPLKYGFQYLAIGNGELGNHSDWSETEKGKYLYTAYSNMQVDEQKAKTRLIHETARKPITTWAFVDPTDNTLISNVPTKVLKLTTLFPDEEIENSDDRYIVEMGLFGGDASNDLNTGYMFNHKMFAPWNKIEGSSLLINWFITF